MDLVASHFLPGLDWLVKLGIGVIVATAGVLLFRQPRRGGLGFALGLFIAETGTLVAIRALVAAGTSSRWQYIMPFGDRKSTRLNSSHSQISYAVFCLKKKKIS